MKVMGIITAALVVCLTSACTTGNVELTDSLPDIYPDYAGVTIPCNIAPLRFSINSDCRSQYAVFSAPGCEIRVGGTKEIAISKSRWRKLMDAASGGGIDVTLYVKTAGSWKEYVPFRINVSPDKIDSYVVYRLIEPGYEIWNEMGIYQRNLENFDESTVLLNSQTDFGCMNCHSFCNRDPEQMLFHLRVGYNGTYFIRNGEIEKLNTKTPETVSALVYPQWHPTGKYVAFSVNSTKQMFHTGDLDRVEVFDYTSDVVIYDVDKHEITSCPALKAPGRFETFPTFSPDGKSILFCSADSLSMPDNYDKVKYSLCRIDFHPEDRSFGSQVDTLINAVGTGRSISFPRVSPDGRHLMFTLSDYGNFSIWHNDSDLFMLDMESGEYRPIDEINSDWVDSYLCWSSSGRWVVFSSRRLDHLYTRLFVAHVDADGNVEKAFVLPQRHVNYYDGLMKSFNIPEFTLGKVVLDSRRFHSFAKDAEGTDLSFSK